MRKVRLGLIGSGLCARDLHWPQLEKMPDYFEIAAVSSRSEEKAKDFAQLTGAKRYYTSNEALLADDSVEAVIITYPFEQNYEIVRQSLDAGKHVLVEKPFAADMIQAAEMVEWQRNTDLVTMIAENHRYREVLLDAKQQLDAGAIGTPQLMNYEIYDFMERDIKWLSQSTWRFSSVGGIILDRDVHTAAAMRLLFGDAKSVAGTVGKAKDDIGPVDHVSMHIVFENGTVGTMMDYTSTIGFSRNDIVILGSSGSIFIDNNAKTLLVANEGGTVLEKSYPNDMEDSYTGEFLDFYHAICDGTPNRSDFVEGYKDLQLMLAAFKPRELWDGFALVD